MSSPLLRSKIPVSNSVTAMELWLLACVILVFFSLLEYSVILWEGVKKRKADITTLSEEEAKENSKRAKVLKTLGNCDVMENIASYLDIQDLGSLYETSHTLRMVSAFIFLVFICQYFYFNEFI